MEKKENEMNNASVGIAIVGDDEEDTTVPAF